MKVLRRIKILLSNALYYSTVLGAEVLWLALVVWLAWKIAY